jgi:hypothetical protein
MHKVKKGLIGVLVSSVSALTMALVALVLIGVLSRASEADWTVAFEGAYEYDYGYGSRISRDVRDGADLDDWIERGNSSVTASPIFADGVRLTAWATATEDGKYDFALASAIYLFDIPKNSKYIKIKVRYVGEGRESDLEGYDNIAGRVWIKSYERRRTKYFDEDDDEATQYGDTFMLRAKRRSETIRIPATHHLDDGILEIHIIAEGNEKIDIESIEVESYQRVPETRVIRRYDRSYYWRPWNYYTYYYFYDGPCYYFTDYDYYISWSLPRYDYDYIEIRRHYGSYLRSYYELYPNSYVHVRVHDYNDRPRVLSTWTVEHEKARKLYDRSRIEKRPRNEYYQVNAEVRTQVLSTLEKQRRDPVISERTYKRTYQKQLRDSNTAPSSEVQESIKSRSKSSSRSRSDSIEQSNIDNTPSPRINTDREELIKRRRYKYEEYKTSPTPPTSPSYEPRPEPQIIERERSSEKKRRDVSSESSPSSQSSVQRARSSPSSSSSSSSSSVSSDDDDEEKKKRSSSSSSSDSSSRKSTRERTKKRRE